MQKKSKCKSPMNKLAKSDAIIPPQIKTEISSDAVDQVNLLKLVASGMLAKFVKEKNGEWDHAAWMCLCNEITLKGLVPINFDKVGLVLEDEKAAYFAERR